MEGNRRVVVVGIPGVGKTTLLTKAVELIGSSIKVSLNNFGTVMFETARENGIGDRDELRKLPLPRQQELQKAAAQKLAEIDDDIVIVDTHAFISSQEGYYPGLPSHVLNIINPTNFISVSAKPEEIYNRRMNDPTRSRDHITIEHIKKELHAQIAMISACAVFTGAPVKFMLNHEGKVDDAINEIIRVLGV